MNFHNIIVYELKYFSPFLNDHTYYCLRLLEFPESIEKSKYVSTFNSSVSEQIGFT